MPSEKLRAMVSELEQELRTLETLDDESRQALESAAQEIRAVLQGEEHPVPRDTSLAERLSNSIEEFEGSHPTLTMILGRLVDGLAQMGI